MKKFVFFFFDGSLLDPSTALFAANHLWFDADSGDMADDVCGEYMGLSRNRSRNQTTGKGVKP